MFAGAGHPELLRHLGARTSPDSWGAPLTKQRSPNCQATREVGMQLMSAWKAKAKWISAAGEKDGSLKGGWQSRVGIT